MDPKSNKRMRAANFHPFEIDMLLTLADKYKHIIDNKRNDAFSNMDRNAAWGNIANSFNARGISASYRSWRSLKLKYEWLKRNTQKKLSLQRQQFYRTGEPSNAPQMGMCSNFSGLPSSFDCDNIEDVTQSATPDVRDDEPEENIKQDVTPNERPAGPSRTLDELSSAQLELVRLQAQIAEKQHKFVEEEHMLIMEHMKNEEMRKVEMHRLLMYKLSQQ